MLYSSRQKQWQRKVEKRDNENRGEISCLLTEEAPDENRGDLIVSTV
jgi:hypothetical protein